jgi:hypothetical protein
MKTLEQLRGQVDRIRATAILYAVSYLARVAGATLLQESIKRAAVSTVHYQGRPDKYLDMATRLAGVSEQARPLAEAAQWNYDTRARQSALRSESQEGN